VFKLIESKMSPKSIRRSDVKAQRMLLALRLAEFRKSLNKDQSTVRGFTQPAVSRIENRGDIRLSTLVEYCRGLGAELKIVARTDKHGSKEFILL
jgi:DNA-binding Xre family transcriptional regulator